MALPRFSKKKKKRFWVLRSGCGTLSVEGIRGGGEEVVAKYVKGRCVVKASIQKMVKRVAISLCPLENLKSCIPIRLDGPLNCKNPSGKSTRTAI